MTTNNTTTLILPPDIPLFATTKDAAKLFGVGRTRLYQMRKANPDFRELTIKSGREVLFDVPRVYKWFQDRCGGELEG